MGMLANTLSYYLPDSSLFSCWVQWLILPGAFQLSHLHCKWLIFGSPKISLKLTQIRYSNFKVFFTPA